MVRVVSSISVDSLAVHASRYGSAVGPYGFKSFCVKWFGCEVGLGVGGLASRITSTNFLGIIYLVHFVPSVSATSNKCASFAVKVNLEVICSIVNSPTIEFQEHIIAFTLNRVDN